MDYLSYIQGMDAYIKWLKILKKENPKRAKQIARKSLIDSGVLNRDGTPKKNICDT